MAAHRIACALRVTAGNALMLCMNDQEAHAMKIAFITSGYYPVIDGVTVSLHNRLKTLSKMGHQVLVICPNYDGMKVYPDAHVHSGHILPGVFVCNVPSSDVSGMDFERNMTIAANAAIDAALTEFAPDVIHVDEPERIWVGTFRKPGLAYARRHNIPCVAVYHTNFIDYVDDFINAPAFVLGTIKYAIRKLIKHVYNAYDVTLVPGAGARQRLETFGVRNTRYETINGVDYALFSTKESTSEDFFENKYGLEGLKDKVKLIFIGRLTEDKNWHFTLSVFPQLLERLKEQEIAVLIAGDGPMKEEILQGLSAVSQNIHVFGRIPQDELYQILQHCDLHVSTSNKENRSLTPIEAMSAGVAVLAPHAGGFIDDIKEGHNGCLFEPDNPADFVEKCARLVEDKALRDTLGHNARRYAEYFAWELCVERLLKIWEECATSQDHLPEEAPHGRIA